MKIGSERILFALCLGFNILRSEASIFDVHKHVADFVRRLWGISEVETREAIDDRHYEPVMERNVFAHSNVPSPPTSSPPSTPPPASTNPITAAPSGAGGGITAAPSSSGGAGTTAAPSVGGGVTAAPTPVQTGGSSTTTPTTAGTGTAAPTATPATLAPSTNPNVTTTAPTVTGGVTLAPSVATNGTVTLAPSGANSTAPETLAPTITGGGALIEAFLEMNVSPGGELKVVGTAQNNALNSVVQNFGSLDPTDPADALVLTNAYVLNTIYHSCGGDLWFMNTNWNSATPPCDPATPWFGVLCDAAGGVANITLTMNDAVGNLPSEIRALTTLSKMIHFCS